MAEPVISKTGGSGKTNWSVLLGAALLWPLQRLAWFSYANSGVFTQKFGADFAFLLF